MKTMTCILAAVAVLAAGCGGDDGGGETTAAADASSPALAYSECMRSNGVPDFPDPENGRLMLKAGPGGLDPESPAFKSAQEACKDKQPSGLASGGGGSAEVQEQVLKFADCMRANGVPSFPDPDVSGGGVKMQLPQGVDPNSAAFKGAQQQCAPLLSELGGAP
jgi:hypothetical protein